MSKLEASRDDNTRTTRARYTIEVIIYDDCSGAVVMRGIRIERDETDLRVLAGMRFESASARSSGMRLTLLRLCH